MSKQHGKNSLKMTQGMLTLPRSVNIAILKL